MPTSTPVPTATVGGVITHTVILAFSDGSNATDAIAGWLLVALALMLLSLGVFTGIAMARGRRT